MSTLFSTYLQLTMGDLSVILHWMPRKLLEPDTKWIKEKIRSSPYKNYRQLAMQLTVYTTGKPFESMALYHLINGRRMLQLPEARQLADLLHVPMIEVIRRWGIPVGVHDIPEDLRVKAGGKS